MVNVNVTFPFFKYMIIHREAVFLLFSRLEQRLDIPRSVRTNENPSSISKSPYAFLYIQVHQFHIYVTIKRLLSFSLLSNK